MHLVSKRLKKDFGDQRHRFTNQSHVQSHNSSMLKLGQLKNDSKTASQEDGIVLLSPDEDEATV